MYSILPPFDIRDIVNVNRNGREFIDKISSILIEHGSARFYFENYQDSATAEDITLVSKSKIRSIIPIPKYSIGDVVKIKGEFFEGYDEIKDIVIILTADSQNVRYLHHQKHFDWFEEYEVEYKVGHKR